jgi:hypothetical protein
LQWTVATLALTADRRPTDEWWIVQQTLAGVAAKSGGAFNNTERGRTDDWRPSH